MRTWSLASISTFLRLEVAMERAALVGEVDGLGDGLHVRAVRWAGIGWPPATRARSLPSTKSIVK